MADTTQAFYSSTIFAEAGYSTDQALLASFGFGVVTFVFAIPAIYTMVSLLNPKASEAGQLTFIAGHFRQTQPATLYLPGKPSSHKQPSTSNADVAKNMAWCLLATGLCFLMPDTNPAKVPLIAFFVYLFACFYGPGIGPIPSIYFSEAFPLSHRELGAAFTICVNNAVGSIVGLTFPSLLEKVTPTGAFGFYAGLCMVAVVVIFFIVPETMRKTLEELDFVFAVPTRKHAAYQVRVWLPWFFRRWFLYKRNEPLPALYHDGDSF